MPDPIILAMGPDWSVPWSGLVLVEEDTPQPQHCFSHTTTIEPHSAVSTSAVNRIIAEVVQSRRRPLLGPSPG